MAEGEFALMERHLAAALKGIAGASPVTGTDHLYRSMLVEAAVQQRDARKLQDYAAPAEESASRAEHRLCMAVADRAWGVLHTLSGESALAAERFARALSIFEAYPAPWQAGRTLFEMGELARAQGNSAAAREHYARAQSAFEQLRAAPDLQRTRAAIAALT